MNKKGKIKKGSLKLDYGLLNIYKMRIHKVLFIFKCMIIIPTKRNNYTYSFWVISSTNQHVLYMTTPANMTYKKSKNMELIN